ncbi:hypothetical protein AN958_12223 [Leucoagaricus sp. SymC.cos]|nr:hypothetical protein AN958_12223 [Leucoagaricus sp. SymC.cos]
MHERLLIDDGHGLKPACVLRYTDKHKKSRAGLVISQGQTQDDCYASSVGGGSQTTSNPWAPFTSRIDWEVAKWAKLRGPGSTAVSELLSIDGLTKTLDLSYKNTDELNKVIDMKLPHWPVFQRCVAMLDDGESIVFHVRNIVECIQSLWRDPDLADDLIFEPERHFADEKMETRMYHDMHTGDWWWKTQLTTFRNKTAYPVYLTLGNIPKHVRRKPSRQAQILLAYLPTSKLEHITNKASRRRTSGNLFHACMHEIVKPLESLGKEGIVLVGGDGARQKCFLILAAYVGDYPEQLLVTYVKARKCLKVNELGSTEYKKACAKVGIKPVQHLFWMKLPFVNIYASITPDILHQLYQGLVKHLISWLTDALGYGEIDKRCSQFPPNHHIRYCVARVRCVFTFPEKALNHWFPGTGCQFKYFAYVEWYTPFLQSRLDPLSRLYKILPLMEQGHHKASIVPISYITQSIHLYLKFGPFAPPKWKSASVLNDCNVFYVNPFSNRFPYSTVY